MQLIELYMPKIQKMHTTQTQAKQQSEHSKLVVNMRAEED